MLQLYRVRQQRSPYNRRGLRTFTHASSAVLYEVKSGVTPSDGMSSSS